LSQSVTRDDIASLVPVPAPSVLRRRIGWLCQALRIGAAVWIGWILVVVAIVWGDKAAVLAAYANAFGVDTAGVSNARYAAAVGVVLVSCGGAAMVAVCIWQLATTYLSGRVFTVDATLWLRRIGLAAAAAVVIDVLARLVIVTLFTGHLMLFPPRGFLVLPQDLLHLIIAAFLLALAHVFKAAAEMADDHAQIV